MHWVSLFIELLRTRPVAVFWTVALTQAALQLWRSEAEPAGAAAPIESDTREALKSLGYLE